jgi:adenosylmethionine-8-amino-7-oxononanoate aminotransferase
MIPAKALTGWYLPLAITLLTEQMSSTFSASSKAERTLHCGHSYSGNALACAAVQAVGAAIVEVCADKVPE